MYIPLCRGYRSYDGGHKGGFTLKFALAALGLSLAAFFGLRLAFLWAFGEPGVSTAELLQALYLGFKFDLRLALLASAPLLLLGWKPRLGIVYSTTVLAGLLVLYAADFGHYAYTRTRLHGGALEHLTPADVALRMVWESYPVVWIVLGIALACSLYAWLLNRSPTALQASSAPPAPLLKKAAQVSVLALLCFAAFWGKWSWYPLRWSDAYFSTNPFVSALGLNPVLFLADTWRNQRVRLDAAGVGEHYDAIATLLEVKERDPQRRSYGRYVAPSGPAPAAPLNLVVIHLESFAGFKVGALGNPSGATPHFDALAREGLLFTNFFVPAVPTARSVFTMLTGIPDYHPGRSASRDPLVVRQHTLINALASHERFYFLGGSASWGNIRGLLSQSIERLQIFEEGDYAAERADVWGVTDHVVFERAHAKLHAASGPFFAFIQTSGNHRPYTIPDKDRHGFELAQRDAATLQADGFDSLAAYNGLRFLDHAIGHFFQKARAAPYFANTVFVLYGDHGNPAASPIPYERLGLTGYHVPMLILAPGLAPAQRDTVASLVDLLPTALGIMRVAHLNKTLGRDLLAERPAAQRFALVPEGVLTDEFFLRVSPANGAHLYAYRSNDPLADLRERLPDTVKELQRLREGLYQASLYLLHHNAPQPHVPPPAWAALKEKK
jgi:phosphoglycerol transferase MdoB-like AlkP superfamily enzyme